ncbi:MAG: 30S ribosomal protein S16 [Candidatus Omnitrophica bacterium]|nr:30S ribosomal protein S16 [Candidatus Omnitrophota bacterium]
MAVVIRLRRIGKRVKKRPFFRISIFDKRRGRDSRCIEEIGYYDPTKTPAIIKIKEERLKYWLGVGAKPSETVSSLIKKRSKNADTSS